MGKRIFYNRKYFLNILLVFIALLAACNTTKHLDDKQYLVRKNKLTLKTEKKITNKGELKDNLGRYMIQKRNSTFLGIPFKLVFYNRHYYRLHEKPDTSLPKSVERPEIFDSSKMEKSAENMRNYLNTQGYFYATVKDTVRFAKKKAYPEYAISTGINYRINNVSYDVDDSAIARIVHSAMEETALEKHKEFTKVLLDDERSRVTQLVRNNGYYYFSQENVNFIQGLDTVDKTIFKDVESPFENAINFISPVKGANDHKIDLTGKIRREDDTLAYTKCVIATVNVYPDFGSLKDLKDSSMITETIDSVVFRYHSEYIHAKVLYEHIYLSAGQYYSQADNDKTIRKLNELGTFQYINIKYFERPGQPGLLDCYIFLSKIKKLDFTVNPVVSSGSTYSLGSSVGVNLRNRNFAKGANLFTIGVNGGIELQYADGNDFIHNFSLLTKYYGVNASIDLPKFIAPVPSGWFENGNLPHTILGVGENVIDRVNYFTLENTSANLSYNWKETTTKTWSFSPAFANIINVKETDSFKKVLAGNEYLTNSYKATFIEGENISFTFDNSNIKHGKNYSFLRLSLEEAGGILSGLNKLGTSLIDGYSEKRFAQYTKFDFDARHYFTLPHSVFAFHFYGGIGLPNGQSSALPYIKQYFAGGPYSLRGWRIRTLGPGSSLSMADTGKTTGLTTIDRTGDIKLEWNGEYRFPIAPLFAGAVKMNGAIFGDAGNIWLAKKDSTYAGGEFEFSTLGQDIAADIGAGARFDIESFLTLRLDIAMPVKKPYIHTNSGWVFDQIDPANSTWRANNIIFNISIGYPF
jgi:outer membrane protein assembly factor BamA